jgi:hypothetical protein
MLVSFSVSNFRSFGQEETLNMVASNKLTDHPEHRVAIGMTGKHVLRSAVIYGANAAGKSNLVQAMSVAQRLILSSDGPPMGIEPFRFDRERLGQPSSFEFRFLLGERVFIYGFDVTSRRIIGEWLAVQKEDDELTIFERNQDGVTRLEEKTQRFLPQDTTLFTTLKLLAQLPLTGHQLFLSRVRSLPAESQGTTLKEVINWLTQDLVILRAQHRTNDTLDRLFRDSAFRYFSSHFLNGIGTGIGDLNIAETKRAMRDSDSYARQFAKSDILPQELAELVGTPSDTYVHIQEDNSDQVVERKLLAVHESKNEEFPIPFSEESDGTQQLLHFMPVLSPSEQNKVFVIDELDRSLHPLLCWEFIHFFSESRPGDRKQLIVTTHEAHLLDQKLLRRDEYWFVEKDPGQQSRLVSLSDFNIRNDLQIQKGYLQGRFGAIPVIGPMEELKRLLAQPSTEKLHAAKKTPA